MRWSARPWTIVIILLPATAVAAGGAGAGAHFASVAPQALGAHGSVPPSWFGGDGSVDCPAWAVSPEDAVAPPPEIAPPPPVRRRPVGPMTVESVAGVTVVRGPSARYVSP
jgi:hypothetical protein